MGFNEGLQAEASRTKPHLYLFSQSYSNMAPSRTPGRTVLTEAGGAAKGWNPCPWGLAVQGAKQWAQACLAGIVQWLSIDL